jgi:hypothetical protein
LKIKWKKRGKFLNKKTSSHCSYWSLLGVSAPTKRSQQVIHQVPVAGKRHENVTAHQ